MAVFVGRNDSGKSNILRALNLFFNNKCDDRTEFQFDRDYSFYSDTSPKKAKEVSIQLFIDIPKAYHRTNGNRISWEKRWRKNSTVYESIQGLRDVSGPRGGLRSENVDIKAKSNLKSLLSNIEFIYVPAIKDLGFFAELRARIYRVISQSATTNFKNSSREFEDAIGEHVTQLTEEIAEALKLKSSLVLPTDLSHVFESLEFMGRDHPVSLEERGEGIKARHIALILKFLIDKRLEYSKKGVANYSFIWAYEEPENSLEFSNQILLSKQFCEFLSDSVNQIMITTHSPVFYNLSKKDSDEVGVISHQVSLDPSGKGTVIERVSNIVDRDMGFTVLLAPHLKMAEEEWELKHRNIETAKAYSGEAILYVEGSTDREFLRRFAEVFFPEKSKLFDIKCSSDGGGAKYVRDMVDASIIIRKHNQSSSMRVAGLVDGDEAGKEAKKGFSDPKSIGKIFTWQPYPTIGPYLAAANNTYMDLEHAFPLSVWEWAQHKGWLESRKRAEYLNDTQLEELLDSKCDVSDIDPLLESPWVSWKVRNDRKRSLVEHVCSYDDARFHTEFSHLEAQISKIVDFLIRQ